MKFSTLAGLSIAAGVVSAAPTNKRTTVNAANKVKYQLNLGPFHDAAKHGHTQDLLAATAAYKQRRWIGQATEVYTLNPDPAYKAIAESYNFDRVTPENSMKWESIEPSPGVFNFDNADALVAWAEANHQAVRGHTLVWHSQLPSWVNNPTTPWTAETLKPVLENHIRTVVSRYKGRVDMWDVANEIFNEDGTFRKTLWYNTFGTDVYRWALTWAHEEDPDALLFINDYNFEYVGAKTDAARAFFQTLIDEGYPLGAVGAQAHLVVGSVSESAITDNFKKFTGLGLELYLTELDIRFDLGRGNDIGNYTASQVGQLNLDYYSITKACLNVDHCLGITVWEYTDKYSWIPGVFGGQGAALPWDINLKPKGAYTAMLEALNGKACSVCQTSGLNA